jgi:hypothetical protein
MNASMPGGANLYAYCLNNPVMFTDSTGMSAWYDVLAWIGVALVVTAAIVLTAGAAGLAVGGLAGAIIHGAAVGALIGAGVGAVGGAVGGMIYDAVQGNSFGTSIWAGTKAGFGIGAIAGMLIGGVAGGISYTPSGLSKSAINQGVKNFFGQSNKVNKLFGKSAHDLAGYTSKTAAQLMRKTLINGTISAYGSARTAIWSVMGSQVTFVIINGAIMISDMWIK